MLDSIYLMKLKLIENHISAVKALQFYYYVCKVVMDLITFPENL